MVREAISARPVTITKLQIFATGVDLVAGAKRSSVEIPPAFGIGVPRAYGAELERTLFIHVGPPKTGTTAVQHALYAHDGPTIVYPKVGLWADRSHHNLVFNYFRDFSRPDVVREDIGGLFDRLLDEARDTNANLVISSEVLAGRKRAADFVEALLARLGSGFRAEFLFVVRDHFERAASVYNQRVKDPVTRETQDPDAFLAQQANGLTYASILRGLRQGKFEVVVLNYHPAETFVSRFLDHVGVTEEAGWEIPVHNVSLSTKALIATLAANRLACDRGDHKRIVAALHTVSGCFAPSKIIFGSHACLSAEKTFVADRKYLREEFEIELPEPCLSREEGAFTISKEEFDEIAAAIVNLKSPAVEICERLRPFVRSANTT